MSDATRIPPPPAILLLMEGQRALLEAATLLPAAAVLRRAPRGDGHPVLVLPGFGAGDLSTAVLRRYLEGLGHDVHPWRFGRNLGPRGDLPLRLHRLLVGLHERGGRKPSLVGWSLGGIYARELARREPQRVRQVITLGSPFRGGGTTKGLFRLVRSATSDIPGRPPEWFARFAEPPPVPSTAIFSRTDGIAAWQACIENGAAHTENIEVVSSHIGLGFNPAVLYAVADRLGQPEGVWAPFHRRGWRRVFYPASTHPPAQNQD